MAGDDDVNSPSCGIEPQLMDIVQHVDGVPTKLDRDGLGITLGPPTSTLPLIAITGAIRCSRVITSGRPISPAWMMCATPARHCSASGRSTPWVSEMTPILTGTMLHLVTPRAA